MEIAKFVKVENKVNAIFLFSLNCIVESFVEVKRLYGEGLGRF